MQRTAMLVGQMKLSMEIISDVTRSSNLEESGQLALARKKLENLNLPIGLETDASAVGGHAHKIEALRFASQGAGGYKGRTIQGLAFQ